MDKAFNKSFNWSSDYCRSYLSDQTSNMAVLMVKELIKANATEKGLKWTPN